jgi:hypothetical protein
MKGRYKEQVLALDVHAQATVTGHERIFCLGSNRSDLVNTACYTFDPHRSAVPSQQRPGEGAKRGRYFIVRQCRHE